MMRRIDRQAMALVVITLIADQLSKQLLLSYLMNAKSAIVPMIDGFFRLVVVWNRGVSFGLMGDSALPPWVLSAVAIAVCIGLFVWLLFRTYAIGRQAARLGRAFPSLAALGIGVWIGVQALINIGVNMGVLPTKGLTLPLLSFGGSGIVANCIALAIVLRIDYENRRLLRGYTV